MAGHATRLAAGAVWVLAASACAPDRAAVVPTELELGAHHVVLVVPAGWELLDQGRQKRFRRGEAEIVLQIPGRASPPSRDAGLDGLVDWGLAELGHDQRRDVTTRRAVTIDGREAIDIETWNRLDHTNPQRMLFVRDDGDLLVLHMVRAAAGNSAAAFEAIRDSLHFVSARR
jgi:hypothetical protein